MNLSLWKPASAGGRIRPRIFLSASVPKVDRDLQYLTDPATAGSQAAAEDDAAKRARVRTRARLIADRVADAVPCLVDELLLAGGQLIFGGHPMITPIVNEALGGFYREEGDGPRPVLLYQSEDYRDDKAPEGREEMAEETKMADLIWVGRRRAEARDWVRRQMGITAPGWLENEADYRLLSTGQVPPNMDPEPLTTMRMMLCMHGAPEAIVFMGGMEGIRGEFLVYRQYLKQLGVSPAGRFFALRSTYGAAAQLREVDIEFFDESFFADRENRAEAGFSGGPLAAAEDDATLEKQVSRKLRYDTMMAALVARVKELEPLPRG